MSSEPQGKLVHILHIGKPDARHARLWSQLLQDGVDVAFARTQLEGLQLAADLQPQIVVINLTNSHFSGDRLCRTLRRRLPNTQRLLITEAGATPNAPCEQHLTRPFTIRKLNDSLMALLLAAAPHLLRAGPLQLDQIVRVVSGPQGQQRLTPRECDLLTFMMRRPNQVVSRRELMEQVWHTDFLGDTRTLDVHIRWLREKVEADPTKPNLLLTKRGIGYLFHLVELESADEELFED